MSSSHRSTSKAAESSARSTRSPSFTTTDPSNPKGTDSRTQSALKAATGTSRSHSTTASHSATGSHASNLSTGSISTRSVSDGSLSASSTISVNTSIPTDMTFSAFIMMTQTVNLTSSAPLSTSPPTPTSLPPTSTRSTSTSASGTNDVQFAAMSHSSGMSTGAIVGIVLGVIAGTLIILVAALCLFRRRYLLRRRAKQRDLYASSTEYSNPFNDDRRYPSLMLEKDNAERMYNYAMGTVTTNPNNAGLLSPSAARDPFSSPRVRMPSTSPPVPPYDGYASSPTFVDHDPMQPTLPMVMTEADLDASYPAAGRLASYPKRSSSWRRTKSKKKKLAELKYRPNSTLTDGERTTTKTIVRIESSSSNEDIRGNGLPSGSYENGPRTMRDVGRAGRSVDGHEMRSRNTFQSYGSTQDGHHPFRFDDRPPYPRDPSAAIASPAPVTDHRRARSDETHRHSQIIQAQYLTAPQAPQRPPRPDSDEGSTFQGISNLLTARSANAPASPPSHYAPSPSPLPTSPPPSRRPFATRSSPTNFEQSRAPPPPSRPAPAHFVQRAARPRGFENPPGSMPNAGVVYYGRASSSVEDDGGAYSGPSTFGEEGTLARSSESWHGGKAL